MDGAHLKPEFPKNWVIPSFPGWYSAPPVVEATLLQPATFRSSADGEYGCTAASEPLADDKGESTVPTSLDPQIASCHRQDAGPPQVEESRQREFLLFSGFQVWRTGTLSRPWAGQAFIRTGQ